MKTGTSSLVVLTFLALGTACSVKELETATGNDVSLDGGPGGSGIYGSDAWGAGGADAPTHTPDAGRSNGYTDAQSGSAFTCAATELCNNGVDDDCDEDTDCGDSECAYENCGTNKACKVGACSPTYENAAVNCSYTPKTGTELCQALGWQGCIDSTGYWWWQCGGTGDCPTAWSGTTCSSFETANDCVGAPMSGGQVQTAAKGCSEPYGATDFGSACAGYNPGYTVRVHCY